MMCERKRFDEDIYFHHTKCVFSSIMMINLWTDLINTKSLVETEDHGSNIVV